MRPSVVLIFAAIVLWFIKTRRAQSVYSALTT